DIFALRVSDNSVRRITATESIEYMPLWSPDGKQILFLGCKRGLTDLETTMEDTHVWVMSADGSARRELGGKIDNRQFNAGWSPDGASVYFIVQQRGSTHLVRMPVAGGSPEFVVKDLGNVGSWTAAAGGKLAYTFRSPSDLGQIYLRTGSGAPKKLT